MRRREHIAPDITPLIDVVFILLIFFLVSSTFKKDELALSLTLPRSNQAIQVIEKKDISIELSKESIAYEGKKITINELDLILKQETKKEKPVNVRIDKDVKYERIIKLFDLLKKHQLYNLALESDMSK